MFYTVYKITNLINEQSYIGAHKTADLNDGYMGSGKLIKNAIKKYGLDNFKKDILGLFEDEETMYSFESELVDDKFVKRFDTYNLNIGGYGNWSEEARNAAKNALLFKMQNDTNWRKAWLDRHSKSKKKLYSLTKHNRFGEKLSDYTKNKIRTSLKEFYANNPNAGSFQGKQHSAESKKKIGYANAQYQKGEGNSQFGTIWIHSILEKRSMKINKGDFPEWENKGWIKGRKMKFF